MYQLKPKRTNGGKLSRCLYELRAAKAANEKQYELAVILYTKALDYHERYGNHSDKWIEEKIEKYKINL